MEKKPINAEELHGILDDVIYGLKDKSMPEKTAKEISNAAGKKIALVKAQIDYAMMWGGRVELNFMNSEDDKLLINESKQINKRKFLDKAAR
jgi:hypothetical protein